MKINHQHGHNFVWNLDSYTEDGSGDGHILSPVNIESDKIPRRMSEDIRKVSFFDPQFYLPHDAAKKLQTYTFFPKNVLNTFSTSDFIEQAYDIAQRCLVFQKELNFQYSVIPTRYFSELPENALEQLTSIFLEPFISEHSRIQDAPPLLLTVIVKPIQLEDELLRSELITWITNYPELRGVYLIFDNDFYSKQIKDPEYLSNQLLFIHYLRQNGLEVHVGYTNTEGYLLSIADPTSVTVGAYENLRSFGTQRLETREPGTQQGPTPRIYSSKLFQWIPNTSLPPMRRLIPDWQSLFDESPYNEYLLNPSSRLNFNRKEIYKHYFFIFSRQAEELPADLQLRTSFVVEKVKMALENFERISNHNVFLDSNSDGSHLPSWMNAISIYNSEIV